MINQKSHIGYGGDDIMKRAIRQIIDCVQRWRNLVTVEWYQDGNTVRVRTWSCGIFKMRGGIPFLCDIDIDPTQAAQSDKWVHGSTYSDRNIPLKRKIHLLVNRILLWRGRAVAVVGWHRDGNTLYLTMQRCGLFKQYQEKTVTCDINISTTLTIQSPK